MCNSWPSTQSPRPELEATCVEGTLNAKRIPAQWKLSLKFGRWLLDIHGAASLASSSFQHSIAVVKIRTRSKRGCRGVQGFLAFVASSPSLSQASSEGCSVRSVMGLKKATASKNAVHQPKQAPTCERYY